MRRPSRLQLKTSRSTKAATQNVSTFGSGDVDASPTDVTSVLTGEAGASFSTASSTAAASEAAATAAGEGGAAPTPPSSPSCARRLPAVLSEQEESPAVELLNSAPSALECLSPSLSDNGSGQGTDLLTQAIVAALRSSGGTCYPPKSPQEEEEEEEEEELSDFRTCPQQPTLVPATRTGGVRPLPTVTGTGSSESTSAAATVAGAVDDTSTCAGDSTSPAVTLGRKKRPAPNNPTVKEKKTTKKKRTVATQAVCFATPLTSPISDDVPPASRLEFFVEGLKVLISADRVQLCKERYSAAKQTSTVSREVTLSHDALFKLVKHRRLVDLELKRRRELIAKGRPDHEVWLLHLEEDLHAAISYCKGKNVLHLQRYRSPQTTPTGDSVTLSVKGVMELGQKTSCARILLKLH